MKSCYLRLCGTLFLIVFSLMSTGCALTNIFHRELQTSQQNHGHHP